MQLVFLFCAAAAAIAAGIGVERFAVGISSAWLAGGFVSGILLQEAFLRRRNEARNVRRLALLHRLFADTRDDVSRIETELRELRTVAGREIVSVSPSPPQSSSLSTSPSPTLLPDGLDTPAFRVAQPRNEAAPVVPRDSGALAAEAKLLHGLVPEFDAAEPRPAGPIPESAPTRADPLVETVRDALRGNRLDLFVRPIVALPQRKRRHYQCAIHLYDRDGGTLRPERYAAAARAAGLGAAMDRMLLFRTVQLVRRLPLRDSGAVFFCGLSADGFTDERFLADFLGYLGSGDGLAEHLVFDTREADLANFGRRGAHELQSLARSGYRLSLSGIVELDQDVPSLVDRGFRFLRIDARRLMPAARSDVEAKRVRRLKQALDRSGGNVDRRQYCVGTDARRTPRLRYRLWRGYAVW